MKSIFFITLISIIITLAGCGTTTPKYNNISVNNSDKPKYDFKKILAPFCIYGVSAYKYKKDHSNWPNDNQLLEHTKALYPHANLSKLTLVSTKINNSSSFEIKSILNLTVPTSINFNLLVEQNEIDKPLLKLSLNEIDLAPKKAPPKNNAKEMLFGLMLAVAFNKMYDNDTIIPLGINAKSKYPEKNETQQKEKFKQMLKQWKFYDIRPNK